MKPKVLILDPTQIHVTALGNVLIHLTIVINKVKINKDNPYN